MLIGNSGVPEILQENVFSEEHCYQSFKCTESGTGIFL